MTLETGTTLRPGETNDGHFSNVGEGHPDESEVEGFRRPALPEILEDNSDAEPRTVGVGDIVTLWHLGDQKKIKVYIAGSERIVGRLPDDIKKELARRENTSGEITMVSPLHPLPANSQATETGVQDTLAQRLEGKPVGAIINLPKAQVKIQAISALKI